MHRHNFILLIIAMACSTAIIVSIVVGVTYSDIEHQKTMSAMVEKGYTPMEAACAMSAGCTMGEKYLSRLIESRTE